VLPGVSSPGVSNLVGLGGFLPHGTSGVLTGVLVAVFSFVGVELPAVAAGEARSPVRTVRRSMRGVPPTTTVLYVGVILAVVTMVPWNGKGAANSPADALLTALGVPHAAQIVNVLVLLAVLTVLNSCLWAASRMAFALAGQGDAPRGLRTLSPSSVPSRTVLLSGLMAFGTVAVQYFAPNGVFLVLVDSAGAVGLMVWLAIAAAYLKLRPVARPWRTCVAWAVVLIICVMLVAMVLVAQTRSQILATLSLAVIVVVIALWRDTI
jgi:GABA permease